MEQALRLGANPALQILADLAVDLSDNPQPLFGVPRFQLPLAPLQRPAWAVTRQILPLSSP